VKFNAGPCPCFALKAMRTDLTTKTGLREQTVGKERHVKQMDKKQSEYRHIHQPFFSTLASIEKFFDSPQLLNFYITFF
jgi:hypothetical protein